MSAYVRHPRYPGSGNGFAADPDARWLSSQPTAFAKGYNSIMASAQVTTLFYNTILVPALVAAGGNATLTLVADHQAVVLVNDRAIGRSAAPLPGLSVLSFPLRAGRNLVVLQCSATGALPVVVATLEAADGSVLGRTDHTWLWL